MEDLQHEITKIIADEARLDPARITAGSTLKDLDIDSLTVIEIVFAIESRFNIELPQRDPLFKLDSVAGLVEAVGRLTAAAAA